MKPFLRSNSGQTKPSKVGPSLAALALIAGLFNEILITIGCLVVLAVLALCALVPGGHPSHTVVLRRTYPN